MKDLLEPIQAHSKDLDAYLTRIRHLPPSPTLMIHLINLFRQSDADVNEIVVLLRRDPALSAEVLRRCNNSFFGQEEPVKDLDEAVFRLGFYEIYQITVMLFSLRTMTVEKEVPGFPAEKLRRHSSTTGIAAGALALEFGVSEGVAFTAGLLHDVGKLALALAEGPKYVKLMEECEHTGASLSAAEKKLYGFNHSEVGARLLQRWGVPEELVIPVLGHNSSVGIADSQTLVIIVNLASRLANQIEEKEPAAKFSELPEIKPLMEFIGLSPEQMLGWEHLVRNKLKQMPGLMMAWSDDSGL